MQAVILTAGFGRRMQPLTDDCHKALMPIGDTTILGRLMDEIVEADIATVHVVTGYRADEVRTFLEQRYPLVDLRFVHNERFAETNNIVSLALALAEVTPREDVLLAECDLLLAPGLLTRLTKRPGGTAALVDRYRPGMDGTVVTVHDGRVTQVITPAQQGRDFTYEGTFKTLNVYRFAAEFCRVTLGPLLQWYAERVDAGCYYEQVLGMLTASPSDRIDAEIVDGEDWAEVDDPHDLAAARFRFEPYQRAALVDRAKGGQWGLGITDFGFMRNVHFPTEAMIAALRHALPELVASYGSTQSVLNEKLAWFARCSPDRVQALNGAAQAYPILRALWRNARAAVPSPTFGEYHRLFPEALTYRDRPGFDPADLEELVDVVDVVVVVNPNNPTGSTLSTSWLRAFAARHPAVVVLVDESFIAFSDQPSIVPMLEADPLPNVVVLTSLSKVLGVPGLRLGSLYSCDTEFITAVGADLPIWNLSAPAEFLLELLLKFRTELAAAIDRTREDRDGFAAALRVASAVRRVHPSGGNFLLVDLDPAGEGAGHLRTELLARELIDVKDVTDRFPDAVPRLRVGVRSPADNRRFVEALDAATRSWW